MARKLLILGAFASIYLLWGSTYLAIAIGLQSIPLFILMGLRSLCGGIVLIALCGGEIARTSRQAWLNASLCGLLFFVGCHGILAWAEQAVSSGVAAIVLATIPFWILLNDFLTARQDRPSPYALAALLPGFLGVAIVAWQDVAGGASLVSIIAMWGAEYFGAASAPPLGRSIASAAATARKPACRPARDGTAACRRYRSQSAA